MLDFEQIYNTIIIQEGYREVRERIIPILQTKIDNFDPDIIKILFSKHRKNKDRLPEGYRNIDAYFSKKFDNDIINRYNNLLSELDKIPDVQITKNEAKRSLFDNLKIAENNEYILYKVPSHEDAVKLVRPGKAVPADCDWPSMLPVSWCITVDDQSGQEMWDQYTDNEQMVFTKLAGNKGAYFRPTDRNFYFAFRKHPLLNQKIDGYQVNPMDFIAINKGDRYFEYTPSPNKEEPIEHWPETVPTEWKKYCKPDLTLIPYENIPVNFWVHILQKYPQAVDKFNKWEKFDGADWMNIITKQPQFVKYCDKYDGWAKMDHIEWGMVLEEIPSVINKFDTYGVWDKLDGCRWVKVLRIYPQFADKCDQCDGWKYMDRWNWVALLSEHPQFINKVSDKMLKHFDRFCWEDLLASQPQLKDIAAKYGYKE